MSSVSESAANAEAEALKNQANKLFESMCIHNTLSLQMETDLIINDDEQS
jgi:hypothetical protein